MTSEYRPPRGETVLPPVVESWTAATLRPFLDHSAESGDRYLAAWHFLATTGVRRGEALGLRWSDLDLDTGRASLSQTVIAVHHEIQFSTPKTRQRRRQISIDDGTVTALREHRRRQVEERLRIDKGWKDLDLVFVAVDGGPLHPERFSPAFDRRVERWNLRPRITLHGLRRTWATLALQAGVHPKVVSERLGHSNIGITLQVYSHVTLAMESGAAEMVAALLR